MIYDENTVAIGGEAPQEAPPDGGIFVPDFGRLGRCGMDRLERELRYELTEQINVEKTQYAVRNAMIRDEMLAEGPQRTIDGLGEKVGAVDLETYCRWEMQEPGCWDNKQFRDEFFRDNPECRAPRPITKATILAG